MDREACLEAPAATTPTVRSLDAGRHFTLRGVAGLVIRCLDGAIWVTQEGDTRDHVLLRCDEMIVESRGLVAVQALRHAEIAVV